MYKSILILLAGISMAAASFFGKPAHGADLHATNFTVMPEQWKQVGDSGVAGCYLQYRYYNDEITDDVVNNGLAEVQISGTDAGGWYPLPHTYYTTGVQVITTYCYRPGFVELRVIAFNNKFTTFQSRRNYKLIVLSDESKE
jgi:hypothetical protein